MHPRAMTTAAGLVTLGAIAALTVAHAAPQSAAPIAFDKDVRPILEANCLSCHGETQQSGRLDLRARESALKGGARGSDIVPGDAEASRLYRRVAGLERPSMPAQAAPLPADQVAVIKHWIEQGAIWESTRALTSAAKLSPAALAALENRTITPEERDYWAFKLPVRAPLPVVSGRDLANPIDRFLEKARRERGLRAAPPADRYTLVRRAYLDLLGLPPTPAQVDAFVRDSSPDAWERLIDALLASPHYGERYGRMWLDVARYADSAGFEYDMHRPNAWRYRDYVIKAFNDDKPFDRFVIEQLAGDEMDGRTNDSLVATGFLRMGPRVLFREKDNPERRYDYLDEIIGTIGKGMLGLTVNCARCHNHKFDPIAQRDYYAIEASIFGYVETEVPLAPKAEADAYLAKTAEVAGRIAAARSEIARIEQPFRDALQLDQIKRRFPDHIVQVILKPEKERTPGEALLAAQVLRSGVSAAQVDRALPPEEASKKKELTARIAALEKERPAPLPMAEIVTDGDYRSSPLGEGDDTVSCPKCRIPVPGAGPYVHTGPGRYEVPPSWFLIRGDVENHGSLMKPGFIDVITFGNPPTEIPRPDGQTSGRRLALAQWIASPQNPMTARVIVNRLWQKHFGRGLVGTLENFGKMGERPTHQDLLDWLAVDLVSNGWSLKRITKLLMMSSAYQMTSAFDDAADAKTDPGNQYLWRFRPQRLDAEIVRDSMLAVGGNINLDVGGEPIFPFIPKDVLAGQYRGKWTNTPDGPAAWRRGVYVYQRRSLPYPMFDTFDHPDMNVTAGARNVSTVPTQALTLLNNPFVLAQADHLAARIGEQARDPGSQVMAAYRFALARPATTREVAIGSDLIAKTSLTSFAHVVLNLDEFLYMR